MVCHFVQPYRFVIWTNTLLCMLRIWNCREASVKYCDGRSFEQIHKDHCAWMNSLPNPHHDFEHCDCRQEGQIQQLRNRIDDWVYHFV